MAETIFERRPKTQRRVVVTGLGAVTPVGLDLESSWQALVKGQSGIRAIESFDASLMDARIAGEVRGFEIDRYIAKKEQKRMDRFIHLYVASTQMALEDSGLSADQLREQNTGSIVGVGIGGLPMIETQHSVLSERGPSRITPFFIPSVIANMAPGQISISHGLRGPNFTVTSACASGAHAIGEAARYIRDGHCKIMISGGAESAVSPLAIGGFAAMKALSTRNDSPSAASRPWDRDRDGFVLSEGSTTLVLEDLEFALKRGAKIYGEITGYGVSSDAYHMTNPSVGGEGAARAMQAALVEAEINPEEVGYINAHGTSTPAGDGVETAAIKKVFGVHSKKIWVSSTKSMMGHTLGAAGAIESMVCLKALHHQVVPPTINLDNPSEDCDLDYVPGYAREGKLNHVLNNSFGFGGTNACLIFSRFEKQNS